MKDPNHYLVVSVAQMKTMAPGLKRYEQLKQLYAEDLLKVTELEYIYKATCEDLDRLRLSEKYLLDSSFEIGSLGTLRRRLSKSGRSLVLTLCSSLFNRLHIYGGAVP